MRRHLNWLACIACLAITGGGCGEKPLPPSSYPGAKREMMESPGLYAAKIKALKEGKDINSVKDEDPTKKMTPRQKAAYQKAQAATTSDTRDAARLKREKEQEVQK